MNSLVCKRTGVVMTGATEGLLVTAHLQLVLVYLHHTLMGLWYGGMRWSWVRLGPGSYSRRVWLRIDALSIPLIGSRVRRHRPLLLLLLHRPATQVGRAVHRIVSVVCVMRLGQK